MSTKSMKSLMVKNQKENRMQLEKIASNLGFKKISVGHSREQEEVAEFTANTLRSQIDTKIFAKSKVDKDLVSLAKAQYKAGRNTTGARDLKSEMLTVITKSRVPNWNIVLKIS